MSKERARRRAEREREAAIKQAARVAEAERRERRAARTRALRAAGRRVGLGRTSGRTSGRPDSLLARKRHRQHAIVLGLLVVLLVVGFAVRPDWPARLAVVVLAVLAYPVLRVMLFKRV